MTIDVKFFASLRETLGCTNAEVAFDPGMNVESVWKASTDNQPMTDNTLCAVNQEYVSLSHPVEDGDEVAFFPPVTGG